MWKRYIPIALAFILITGPGALDAWLSLFERFFGEDRQVTVNAGSWYQALFPVLGLAVLLFGIWWTRPKKSVLPTTADESPDFQAATPASGEQLRADWMTAALNRDDENLERCLRVHDLYMDWKPMYYRAPHITLRFDVSSSSVLLLDIGEPVKGRMLLIGEECEHTPEVMSPIQGLKRSRWKRITIRQPLSQAELEELIAMHDKTVEFGFGGLDITVHGKLPDDSLSQSIRLPLPGVERVKMPSYTHVLNC